MFLAWSKIVYVENPLIRETSVTFPYSLPYGCAISISLQILSILHPLFRTTYVVNARFWRLLQDWTYWSFASPSPHVGSYLHQDLIQHQPQWVSFCFPYSSNYRNRSFRGQIIISVLISTTLLDISVWFVQLTVWLTKLLVWAIKDKSLSEHFGLCFLN